MDFCVLCCTFFGTNGQWILLEMEPFTDGVSYWILCIFCVNVQRVIAKYVGLLCLVFNSTTVRDGGQECNIGNMKFYGRKLRFINKFIAVLPMVFYDLQHPVDFWRLRSLRKSLRVPPENILRRYLNND